MNVTWQTRIFEDKMALDIMYKYDGSKGGDEWRRRTHGYFIGCCPSFRPLLWWAEQHDARAFSLSELKKAQDDQEFMVEEDAVVLSGHIWRFLRTCLHGGAAQVLESCGEDLNGLEVWRRLVYRIEQGREQRVEDLRELIDKPPKIPNLVAVPAAIDAYDKLIKEYTSATNGSENVPDGTLKRSFEKSLPQDLREALMWRGVDPHISYEAYKEHVRTTAMRIIKLRGQTPAYALEQMPYDMLKAAEYEDTNSVNGSQVNFDGMLAETAGEDELLVFAKKMFSSPQGRQNFVKMMRPPNQRPGQPQRGAQQPLRGEQARGDRRAKCVNCGGDHPRAQCPKPAVEPSKRPCFNCGKVGHISSQCPTKSQAPARNTPAGLLEYNLCLESEEHEEFKVPRRTVKPQPKGTTMGDYFEIAMKKAKGKLFAELMENNEDNFDTAGMIEVPRIGDTLSVNSSF